MSVKTEQFAPQANGPWNVAVVVDVVLCKASWGEGAKQARLNSLTMLNLCKRHIKALDAHSWRNWKADLVAYLGVNDRWCTALLSLSLVLTIGKPHSRAKTCMSCFFSKSCWPKWLDNNFVGIISCERLFKETTRHPQAGGNWCLISSTSPSTYLLVSYCTSFPSSTRKCWWEFVQQTRYLWATFATSGRPETCALGGVVDIRTFEWLHWGPWWSNLFEHWFHLISMIPSKFPCYRTKLSIIWIWHYVYACNLRRLVTVVPVERPHVADQSLDEALSQVTCRLKMTARGWTSTVNCAYICERLPKRTVKQKTWFSKVAAFQGAYRFRGF